MTATTSSAVRARSLPLVRSPSPAADMLTLGTALTASSLSITGGTLMLATNTTPGSGTGTSNVTLGSLSITGNGVLDVTNNHIIISFGSGSDPIP